MAKSNIFIENQKNELDKAVENLKQELKSLRSGRAQSAMIENLQVEAYGAVMPLKQVASINIPEPGTMNVQPWDKNNLKPIEKAIGYSNLGLAVVNSGDKLIVKIPPMTEENKKEILKVLSQKLETVKITIRKLRDQIKEKILKAEKEKEITEDDKFRYIADLDNFINDYAQKIDQMGKEKEEEIMTV